jgi:outer membrane protein assembly factor BamA
MGRPCLPASLAALLILAPHAAAQDVPDAGKTAQDAANVEAKLLGKPDKAEDKDKPKKKRDMLVVPVPISNPSSGTGLAVGGVVFYNPLNEPQQWVSGGGVLYTDRGTKGIGLFHTMSLGQDKYRFRVIAVYTDGPLKYYGTGAAAGDAGNDFDFKNKNLSVQAQGQIRAFGHGYLGVRYKYSHYDATPPDALPPGTSLPPADQLNSTLSMLGPFVSYDTRDSATLPRSGMFLSASWLAGIKFLGNSFPHSKVQLASNFYLAAGARTTLALRGSLCGVTGTVPFYDLCNYGQGADLRGYEAGRYRDRVNWAAQGELRHQFNNRIGGVVFAGVGGIAPSLTGIIGDGNVLPSMGLGVRYKPFRHNDVNLRADIALGFNGPAFYFGISEAF